MTGVSVRRDVCFYSSEAVSPEDQVTDENSSHASSSEAPLTQQCSEPNANMLMLTMFTSLFNMLTC